MLIPCIGHAMESRFRKWLISSRYDCERLGRNFAFCVLFIEVTCKLQNFLFTNSFV